MKENITQQSMMIPERGINVLIPPHASHDNSLEINDIKNERLRLIEEDKILKNRYPTPQEGIEFTQEVCFSRRNELLNAAIDLTPHIIEEWENINQEKPVCVILFGSVAKGLVKHNKNTDPSNIDISVIGTITKNEKIKLLNSIRPHRDEAERRIRLNIDSDSNAGVHIQNVDTLIKNNYAEARKYISSSAFPLYDPIGMWAQIEQEALSESLKRRGRKRKNMYVKDSTLDDVYQNDIQTQNNTSASKNNNIYRNVPLPNPD